MQGRVGQVYQPTEVEFDAVKRKPKPQIKPVIHKPKEWYSPEALKLLTAMAKWNYKWLSSK